MWALERRFAQLELSLLECEELDLCKEASG